MTTPDSLGGSETFSTGSRVSSKLMQGRPHSPVGPFPALCPACRSIFNRSIDWYDEDLASRTEAIQIKEAWPCACRLEKHSARSECLGFEADRCWYAHHDKDGLREAVLAGCTLCLQILGRFSVQFPDEDCPTSKTCYSISRYSLSN